MSLRLMRDKGIISEAEYESAVHDLSETLGARAADQGTAVVAKWAATLYGFVDVDSIYDTTRSLNDLPGTPGIARSGTSAGDNPRFTFGVRNSRIGLRLKAPEVASVRASAQAEMDFLGTQLPIGVTQPYNGSEAAFFTNPTFRIRHMNLKLETPVVDILFGQYWQLFGWQSAYQPNTVQLQGVPGELYSRTPQLRISKTIKADPVTFEVAVAAVRPVQRDSGTPDGEAGLRFAIDSWTGMQTIGQTGQQLSPASVAVSGMLRHVAVNTLTASKNTNDLGMSAIAVDGFLPLIPATKEKKGNSLSLNGEFATGYGFADMYTGLTGGITFPTVGGQPFAADIDTGIVTYDTAGHLHGIQWTSYLFGGQYYLPELEGNVWIAGNYSHVESNNIATYAGTGGNAAKTAVFDAYDFFDAMLWVKPVPSVQFGFEYANFNTKYVDGQHAINHRFQLSGFFIY